MSVSKTFSAANTQSDTLKLSPGATAAVTLTVAGGETFTGNLQLQVSHSLSGGPWSVAHDTNGADIADFTSIVAATEAVTVKNDTTKDIYLRARVTTNSADDVVYVATEREGDEVEVLLRDPWGLPILTRTDVGLKLTGDLEVTGDVAASGASAINDAEILVEDFTISAADIVSTSAGKLGHASGFILVPDASVGADQALELISAILIYDYATAAYTAGGNITINHSGGGAAITGLVSAANSLGAAADKVVHFLPLATAGNALVVGNGINLVAASAFTNPGTAAGTVTVRVHYRLHTLGLS